MPTNEQRRKRKLQAKRARRKNRKLRSVQPNSLTSRLQAAARWPVYSAHVSRATFEQGIGYALLGRCAPNGTIASALFLIDMYCMGAKDAFVRIDAEPDAKAWLAEVFQRGDRWIDVTAEYVCKFVQDAVDYAQSLGIPPHPAAADGSILFGDLDRTQCRQVFEFGKDGMPLFIAGPHDGPGRIQRIMQALQQSCGDENFHYVLPVRRPLEVLAMDEIENDPQMNIEGEFDE